MTCCVFFLYCENPINVMYMIVYESDFSQVIAEPRIGPGALNHVCASIDAKAHLILTAMFEIRALVIS
jgi:hypothetical protein